MSEGLSKRLRRVIHSRKWPCFYNCLLFLKKGCGENLLERVVLRVPPFPGTESTTFFLSVHDCGKSRLSGAKSRFPA